MHEHMLHVCITSCCEGGSAEWDHGKCRTSVSYHEITLLYRICWLASLRTRSTSLPLSSSSLVRVPMVSLREWISWSRSVMRLLREHTSACRSEI